MQEADRQGVPSAPGLLAHPRRADYKNPANCYDMLFQYKRGHPGVDGLVQKYEY